MSRRSHLLKKGHSKRSARLDSWQIIYIDFMTQVMIFFVILWSLQQGKSDGISDTIGDTSSRMINLPGDVIFEPGKTYLSPEGRSVFRKLFAEGSRNVLNFDTSGLVKRVLVIHGHTDSDGDKNENYLLGYERAFTSFQEILQYSKDLPHHVVLCTHADNTPEQAIPLLTGEMTASQKESLRAAKARNRRITIEDKIVDRQGEL